ncbi:hypothetical protein Arub01_14800 [Actinomadura rubrobrunea]|uniref:Uncharacterized protein n=1 Tax=Actinomadura rubrobrunea TaxID=115335 RepID=A0A9W6PU35_9ACTN|nr:hypothetical protein [Actinomadura rubrobrunea]GLW63236.1 hypothetical protein Arub01_14800 [Actinomadura rubrobrunea]
MQSPPGGRPSSPHCFGLCAIEHTATGAFLGFTGLWTADFRARFTPAVEIGPRPARPTWGRGHQRVTPRPVRREGTGRGA